MNDAATLVDRPVEVAGDVMTRDPDRVAGSDSLLEVAGRMRSLLVAFLPVCDPGGDLQGIIALRDLPCVVRGEDPTAATASSLAQQPAVTIGVNEPVDHVWDLMAERRVWLLPVLDGRRLVGVIRYLIGAGPSNPSVRVSASYLTPQPSRLTGPSPADSMRRRVSIAPDHRLGVTSLAAGRQTPHQVSAQTGHCHDVVHAADHGDEHGLDPARRAGCGTADPQRRADPHADRAVAVAALCSPAAR